MPKYLPKDEYFVCIFQKDMFKVVGDKIRLSLGRNFAKEFGVRFLEFKLPSNVVGKKMAWLLRKRKNVINNFMNQAVNYIVKYCLANRIGNIVIGELKEIKNGMNMGKINNQNFQYIPYGLFKQKLKSKCEYYYGINYNRSR